MASGLFYLVILRVEGLLTDGTACGSLTRFPIALGHRPSLVLSHLLGAILRDELQFERESDRPNFTRDLLVLVSRGIEGADHSETHEMVPVLRELQVVARLQQRVTTSA